MIFLRIFFIFCTFSFLQASSQYAISDYEISDEDHLSLSRIAENCAIEDLRHIREHDLDKDDALRFAVTPRRDVSQIPESNLLSAQALIVRNFRWEERGSGLPKWRSLVDQTVDALKKDGTIFCDALVALAYIRGIEPCQRLLTQLCGESWATRI